MHVAQAIGGGRLPSGHPAPVLGLAGFWLALTMPAFANAEVAMPGPISDAALSSAIAVCGSGQVILPDPETRLALLEPGGWREMTAADRDWYLAISTQSGAGWEVVDKRGAADATEIWQLHAAAGAAPRRFTEELPLRIIYRSPEGAMLSLGLSGPLCTLFSADSPAAAAAFDALEAERDLPASFPKVTSRVTEAASWQGGLYEGNRLDTTAFSEIFETDFRLAYVFLITAPDDVAGIRH